MHPLKSSLHKCTWMVLKSPAPLSPTAGVILVMYYTERAAWCSAIVKDFIAVVLFHTGLPPPGLLHKSRSFSCFCSTVPCSPSDGNRWPETLIMRRVLVMAHKDTLCSRQKTVGGNYLLRFGDIKDKTHSNDCHGNVSRMCQNFDFRCTFSICSLRLSWFSEAGFWLWRWQFSNCYLAWLWTFAVKTVNVLEVNHSFAA